MRAPALPRLVASRLVASCVAASLLALLAPGAPARAQRLSPVTGEALAKLCAGKAVTGCDAYVSGVSDFGELLSHSNAEPGAAQFCIPIEVKTPALRQAVVAWAEGHPDDARMQAAMLVVHALHASYPCKGGTPAVR